MDDLITWLLEQVATDEVEATAAFSGQMDPENGWGIDGRAITPHVGVIHEEVQRVHVAKWNPARVLAECEAKRQILKLHTGTHECPDNDWLGTGTYTVYRRDCQTLRLLAEPFSGHPEYQESWRP